MDITAKIVETCLILLAHSKRVTITSREIQTALRALYPGAAAPYVSAGVRAVTEYNTTEGGSRVPEDNQTRKVMRSLLDAGGHAELRIGAGAPIYLRAALADLAQTGEPLPVPSIQRSRLLVIADAVREYGHRETIGPKEIATATQIVRPLTEFVLTEEDLAGKGSKQEISDLSKEVDHKVQAAVPACLARALEFLTPP